MKGRLIAIGDVHGCSHELATLLERVRPTTDDQLVFLGDLINRGPDTPGVLDLVRQHGGLSLLGNHELRLLEFHRTGDRNCLKETDAATVDVLRPEDWQFLETMPLTHAVPELNTVFVHGGFLPGIPWQKQGAEIVTRIQVVSADGQPAKRAECPTCPLWADRWSGPPFVVYGHTPRPDIYKLKWSVGIDTACVMGGHLTAYILPERRFVQVKARRAYFPSKSTPS